MDIVISLLVLGTSTLLVAAPPVVVWRVLKAMRPAQAAGLRIGVALLGPWLACYALMVLAWLPAYAGQCGGWLGETTPCTGWWQYAQETLFWAAMGTVVPGGLGVLMGGAVVLVHWIQRWQGRRPG
ncbi:MAG: hypothetical protein ACK520_09265 [Inhella sp.]|jgi:hypothetical protein|uniref:hypothetical protein n=1 Tax=Inhella sp. TaxID=1921806 RepID=UPI0022C5EB34|nr:hypothetical protein [Inhella sp.]MCZ8236370.1 hypothetical protein [Inhella sp.]